MGAEWDGPDEFDTTSLWDVVVLPQELQNLQPLMSQLGRAADPMQKAYLSLQFPQQRLTDFRLMQAGDRPDEYLDPTPFTAKSLLERL